MPKFARIRSAVGALAVHAAELAGAVFAYACSFDARFWLFFIGLVFATRGAAMISPALGWLTAGLLIIWDCSRGRSNQRGGR